MYDQTPPNPYAVPNITPPTPGYMDQGQAFPTIITVVGILELVLLALRSLAVAAAILVFFMPLKLDNQMRLNTYFEVGSGLLVILTGVPAMLGMLLKKPWAIPLGLIYIVLCTISILFGVYQSLVMIIDSSTKDTAQMIGAIVGASISILLRLLFLALLVVALLKFKAYLRSSPQHLRS